MKIIEVTNLSKYFYPPKGRRKGKIENNLKQKKKDILIQKGGLMVIVEKIDQMLGVKI